MNENEPDPVLGMPDCPAHITGEAKAEWNRLGKQMIAEGRMAVIYKGAFAAYCVAWGRWVYAEEQLREFGLVIKSPHGHLVQSPYLPIANKALAQMRALIGDPGISPTSQARVSTVEGAATVDPSEDFSEWLQPRRKHRFSRRREI